MVFFNRPLSGSILAITALLVIGPWAWKKFKKA